MKPIRLEIKGLNSYINKQVVDFSKLTERGLFGIFGKTGSGKSTILDAMTLALYGDISRSTKEYINSMSDTASIKYEFEIGVKNSRKRYEVERTIKRNNSVSKGTKGVKTSYARMIEKRDDGTINVMAEKVTDVNEAIISVIGLTSNDFTKSVVLPQDKFNDFLRLGGSDRRNMLERIFGLEKYGRLLTEKVKERKKKREVDIEKLKVSLSYYEGKTKEEFDNMNEELVRLGEEIRQEKKSFDEKKEQYEADKIIYENQKRLLECEKELEEYNDRRDEIEELRKKLEKNKKANRIIPYIKLVEDLENKSESALKQIKEADNALITLRRSVEMSKVKYENTSNDKEEKIPVLSQNKLRYEDAIKDTEDAVVLKNEIINIKNKIDVIKDEKKSEEKIMEEDEADFKRVSGKIKELNSELDDIRVPLEYRKMIEKAGGLEEELKEITNELDEINTTFEKKNNERTDLNYKLRINEGKTESAENKVNQCKDRLEILEKKCPATQDEIHSMELKLSNIKNEIGIVQEYEERKNKIQDDLTVIREKTHRVVSEYKSCSEKLNRIRKNIEEEEKNLNEKMYMNRVHDLRKELEDGKPCPVCGSVHHILEEVKNYDVEIELIKNKISELKLNEIEENNRYEKLSTKKSGYASEEMIKSREMKEAELKLGGRSSRELNKKYDDEIRIFNNRRISLENWIEDNKNAESDLEKRKEDYSLVEKEGIRLSNEKDIIDEYIKMHSGRKCKLEERKEEISGEILQIKAKTKVTDIRERLNEIIKNEERKEEIEELLSNLNKEREELDSKNRVHVEKINACELELSNELQKQTIKKESYRKKSKKIENITKGEKPEKLLEETEKEIESINSAYNKAKEEYDNNLSEMEEYEKRKTSLKGQYDTSSEQLGEQKKVLEEMLYQDRFDSIYTVIKHEESLENIEIMSSEISKYDEGRNSSDVKIRDIREILGDKKVDNNKFEELGLEIRGLESDISEKVQTRAVLNSQIEQMRKDIDKAEKINLEYKKVTEEYNTLEEIGKVIRGNKFVEYVASNHLKYIALEASNKLSSITGGRYALEINSALEFVVRDNFNGGERRGIETLSGGETFLTSLSLALALSSQIQMKGSAPLEFFFLDEGFGSLDTELLDTVMEALEKLHKSDLSIGIISHVEELKNRVPVKLIVSAGDIGEGSSVKLEYS